MTTPLEFNDLLRKADYDTHAVVLLRHRPWEAALRRVFAWVAGERPDLFDAYQSTHAPHVEGTLKKAQYVASFIGHEPGKALFVGLYHHRGNQPMTHAKYWSKPAHRELKSLGMSGFKGERASILHFDLVATPFCREWKGKLVCEWSGERSWCRRAERNRFAIHAIHEESALVKAMPDWQTIVLSWAELKTLPKSWKTAMSQWRGIYFIFDKKSRQGYVGSAYGAQNLLGRWLGYAATGHGGNRLLKTCHPQDFAFSLLERVSPDLPAEQVITLENRWKDRLCTRMA